MENALSSFESMGRPLLSFLIVPVGACAVFILEYGLNLLFFSLSGVCSLVLVWSRDSLLLSPYAWKGFRKTVLLSCDFCGEGTFVRTDAFRLFGAGWKDSSRTLTKLLGKSPVALGSLRSRPIHHRPSPALSASMRSPSMNPRSFLLSPPHEYVARHQQGKAGSCSGAPILR